MPVDSLAPEVTRASAGMVLTVQDTHEKKLATMTGHGELTVTKMVTASHDWAVTWAVIELWPSRDLAVIELWPCRDWAVT